MRILLLHDYGTLNGGAEIMITNFREALRKRGHDVLLFTSTAKPLPLPIMADETCFGTVSPLRRGLQATNPHAMFRLRQVIQKFGPDAAFCKMFLTQLSPLILPLLRHVPSVLSIVNYNLICPLNTKTLPDGSACQSVAGQICRTNGCLPLSGLARAAVQRRLTDLSVFDHIVANSRWVMERLQAENVPVNSWVHNGVPGQEQRPPLGDQPRVAYAGRLIPKKGVDLLISAMAAILKQVPEARLTVAGDGPERRRLEGLAESLGIREAIEFTGHIDASSLEQTLAQAWVQVVPSRWEEPFGLVVAEAMMRGTAVVASNSGGITEQVLTGKTGYLVPPGDSSALAEAMLQILTDRDLAERLGARGRQEATARFTFEHHVDRMLEIIKSVTPSM